MSTKGVSTVATEDSGKLVKHIDEAKDWLDKAKQEYTESNPIRGEMILNLAQAEIKYAWELSHVRSVSHNNDPDKPRVLNLRSKLVLPIAATILVVLAASLVWFMRGNSNLKPQAVALIEKTLAGSESSGFLTGPEPTTPKVAADNQTKKNAGAELDATPAVGKLVARQKPLAKNQPLAENQSSDQNQLSAKGQPGD
ncbi:MAG TPA: hypothetical protein VHY08_28675, partial [Bacillota bacterium]|nr:hypothetical protein [Bacillota bacterium]